MKRLEKFAGIFQSATRFVREPRLAFNVFRNMRHICRGYDYARAWQTDDRRNESERQPSSNPLREFVEARETGRGVWKWDHYHDAYHRHLERFIGREVHVMEVGIYSGGSLEMWRSYFGPQCYVYGVDIMDECRVYENDHTKILIGDQQNREFWRDVRQQVPKLDILIDDGGHEQEQQIVTLEEMLPHLQPGGVFICEDIRGEMEGFSAFAHGLINSLNDMRRYHPDGLHATAFQTNIASVHSYPFVSIVEKHHAPVSRYVAPKRGTEWQPFLDHLVNEDDAKTKQ